jgi:hypothetical protein
MLPGTGLSGTQFSTLNSAGINDPKLNWKRKFYYATLSSIIDVVFLDIRIIRETDGENDLEFCAIKNGLDIVKLYINPCPLFL